MQTAQPADTRLCFTSPAPVPAAFIPISRLHIPPTTFSFSLLSPSIPPFSALQHVAAIREASRVKNSHLSRCSQQQWETSKKTSMRAIELNGIYRNSEQH